MIFLKDYVEYTVLQLFSLSRYSFDFFFFITKKKEDPIESFINYLSIKLNGQNENFIPSSNQVVSDSRPTLNIRLK